MTTIVGTLPSILTNGTTADATQVMADFNYIVSQVNANAAAAGANSDITSLTGLTTPLAVGRGGTGASTAGATLLQNVGAATFLRGQIAGLQISAVASSTITITAGVCCDSSGATLITLPTFSKLTSGVWSAGSGANGLGTGVTLASSQTLHVFAIAQGTTFDAYLDTSATAANAPSGVTGYRRLFSLRTGSTTAALLGVTQVDDNFIITTTPVVDGVVVNSTTSAGSQNLTVPLGLNLTWVGDAAVFGAAALSPKALISSLLQGDVAATASTANLITDAAANGAAARIPTLTNTSAQIRWRADVTSSTFIFLTTGWIDGRGRTGGT